MKFEYWKSALDHQWYWHLKSADHEKIAQGEPYASEAQCLRAITAVQQAGEAVIDKLSPPAP